MYYEFGTSPKKVYPEYDDLKIRTRRKTTRPKKTNRQNIKTSNKKKTKPKKRSKAYKRWKILQLSMTKTEKFYVIMLVGILLALAFVFIVRESEIDKKFMASQDKRNSIEQIEKENSQIELSFQNSLSLTNIEKQARERLGMEKQSPKNTVYVNFDSEDFVESVVVNRVQNEEKSFIQKIIDKLSSIF